MIPKLPPGRVVVNVTVTKSIRKGRKQPENNCRRHYAAAQIYAVAKLTPTADPTPLRQSPTSQSQSESSRSPRKFHFLPNFSTLTRGRKCRNPTNLNSTCSVHTTAACKDDIRFERNFFMRTNYIAPSTTITFCNLSELHMHIAVVDYKLQLSSQLDFQEDI